MELKFLLIYLSTLLIIVNGFSPRNGIYKQWKGSKTVNNKKSRSFLDTSYVIKYVPVKIDHFNIDEANANNTFNLKYLYENKYYVKGGPIFIYCGNEGPIEDFYSGTGFMRETLASKYKALVIYGEHRFFGESFPFSTKTQDYDISKNKYLTSEQALSDYVVLLNHIKTEFATEDSKIIAFGGSYGGMLSSWIRMKFPHLVTGAVASSAPILLFENPSNEFFKLVTNTYKRYENDAIECTKPINEGLMLLSDLIADQSKQGKKQLDSEISKQLTSLFSSCQEINSVKRLQGLLSNLEDSLVSMVQYNYPYAVGNMPENPAQFMCKKVSEQVEKVDKTVLSDSSFTPEELIKLKNIAKISKAINEINQAKCFETLTTEDYMDNPNGWSFMACTQMVMPIESDGVTDMFHSNKFDFNVYSEDCKKIWKGDLKPKWIFDYYGGRNINKDLKEYSRIIFVNGTMDPWYAGCPKESSNPSIKIYTADSAHHLDLRTPNDNDPDSMKFARDNITKDIGEWLS